MRGKELSLSEIERPLWKRAAALIVNDPRIHVLIVNGVKSAWRSAAVFSASIACEEFWEN